jgi:hypothetical protein
VNIAQTVAAAFMLASSRFQELHRTWISISAKVGGQLPNSLLVVSVQRSGELDMLLRGMEDDFSPTSAGEADFSVHYQKMLSELWISEVYEVFRLLAKRKIARDSNAFETLERPAFGMNRRGIPESARF